MAFVSEALAASAPAADSSRSDKPAAAGPNLTWEEIGLLGRALAVAPKQWRSAAHAVRERYSLGPRGPWIVGLLETGRAATPSDFTGIFHCGRSLITAELNRLVDAGLVTARKCEEDGRQVRLSLTAEGEAVCRQVGEALVRMVDKRLAGYTREEVLLCARLLRDFSRDPD